MIDWAYNSKQAPQLPPTGELVEFYTDYSAERYVGRLILRPCLEPEEPVWFIQWPSQREFQHLRHKDCVRLWRLITTPVEHLAYLKDKAEKHLDLQQNCLSAFVE